MNKSTGFTLLELLVALAVFSILSLISYQGLGQFLSTQQYLEQQENQLRRLQLTLQRLETDLQQAIARPIRNEFGDTQAAFIGDRQGLRFSRSGLANYRQEKRSDLQRLAWFVEEGSLYRGDWQVLDRAQDSQMQRLSLLSHISELNWQYIDAKQQAHDTWPPNQENPQQPSELIAVQLHFKHTEWGEIKRLFELPQTPIRPKASSDLLTNQ